MFPARAVSEQESRVFTAFRARCRASCSIQVDETPAQLQELNGISGTELFPLSWACAVASAATAGRNFAGGGAGSGGICVYRSYITRTLDACCLASSSASFEFHPQAGPPLTLCTSGATNWHRNFPATHTWTTKPAELPMDPIYHGHIPLHAEPTTGHING